MNKSLITANRIASLLQTQASVLLTGLDALSELRSVLQEAQHQLGVEVYFDPSSDPDLTQFVAGATLGSLDGALKGAAMGLLVGALLKDPRAGMVIGAALGGTLGAVHGATRVKQGWRVRLSNGADGLPFAEITTTEGAHL